MDKKETLLSCKIKSKGGYRMKKERIKYKSYYVTIYTKDLNPFMEIFDREIRANFISSGNTSYCVEYVEGIVNGGLQRIKTTADNKQVCGCGVSYCYPDLSCFKKSRKF